jgi:hypothetical protein
MSQSAETDPRLLVRAIWAALDDLSGLTAPLLVSVMPTNRHGRRGWPIEAPQRTPEAAGLITGRALRLAGNR